MTAELSAYQKELSELSEKLKALKKKYLGKSESRRCAEVRRARREAERVGSDLRFVRSLVEGLEDLDTSLASRLLKRVIPGKAPPPVQDISAEFKRSLLAFSTRFFQDRLNYIESAVRLRTELDSTQSSSPFSDGSRPEVSQVTSDTFPYKKSAADVCFFTCPEPSEKSVQTDYCNFVPKLCLSNSSEKFVQTDDPSRPTIIGEILEALKKISEDYVPSDRSAFHESDFSNDGFSEFSAKDSEWGYGPQSAEFGMNRRERERKRDKTEAFRMEIRSVDIVDEAKFTVHPDVSLTKKTNKNERKSEKTNSRKVHIVEFHETGLGQRLIEKQKNLTDIYVAAPSSGLKKNGAMKKFTALTRAKSHEVELWPSRDCKFWEDPKIHSKPSKLPVKTKTRTSRSEQRSPSSKKPLNVKSYDRSDSGRNLNELNPGTGENRPPPSPLADKVRRKTNEDPLKKLGSHGLRHRRSEEIATEVKRKVHRCNSSESSYHRSLESVVNKEGEDTTPGSRQSKASVSSRTKSRKLQKADSQEQESRARAHGKESESNLKDRTTRSRPNSGNKERRKESGKNNSKEANYEEMLGKKDEGTILENKSSNCWSPGNLNNEQRKKTRRAKSHDSFQKSSRVKEEGMPYDIRETVPPSAKFENKGRKNKLNKADSKEDNFQDDTHGIEGKSHLRHNASDCSSSSTWSKSNEKEKTKQKRKLRSEEVEVDEVGELAVRESKSSTCIAEKKRTEDIRKENVVSREAEEFTDPEVEVRREGMEREVEIRQNKAESEVKVQREKAVLQEVEVRREKVEVQQKKAVPEVEGRREKQEQEMEVQQTKEMPEVEVRREKTEQEVKVQEKKAEAQVEREVEMRREKVEQEVDVQQTKAMPEVEIQQKKAEPVVEVRREKAEQEVEVQEKKVEAQVEREVEMRREKVEQEVEVHQTKAMPEVEVQQKKAEEQVGREEVEMRREKAVEVRLEKLEAVGARQAVMRFCLPGPRWPIVYHRRETEGRVTREGGVTVRLARHLDTLLINHSHQPGTIILADFGGSPTEAEILGRIVGYLVGVPPPVDKT